MYPGEYDDLARRIKEAEENGENDRADALEAYLKLRLEESSD